MKRLLSICLVLILLVGCLPMTMAQAADPTSGTVVGGKLRLRAQPSTKATIITAYPTGTVLSITKVYDSEWFAVTGPDGFKGYVMRAYVDTTGGGGGGGLYTATIVSANGKGVRLRYGPSTAYGVQAVYPVGTKVTVLNHGTYWDRIRIGFRTGYMMNQFLYSGSTPEPTDSYYATVYASNGYGVRLRSYPSTNAPIIGLYSVGTTVLVLKHDLYWDYIRVGTRQGYMMNQFLVTSGTITSVDITPSSADVEKGDSVAFSATVSGTGYYNNRVEWTVSGETSANTAISQDGVLTIDADETADRLTVKATSVYNRNKSDTAIVNVSAPVPTPVVTDVIVTAAGGATTVLRGGKQQFSAVVEGEDSPMQDVKWKLNGTYDVDTKINSKGMLTVSAKESKSSIVVMATSVEDPSKNGTTTIAVVDKLVKSISIKTQPTNLDYFDGETLDLSGLVVTMVYDDDTKANISADKLKANKLVASPANGASLSVSKHNDKPITIVYNKDSGISATTSKLTVAAKSVVSLAITSEPTKTDYFEQQHFDPAGLKLLVTYADGSTTKVEYSSATSDAFSFSPALDEDLSSSTTAVTIGYAGKTASQAITVAAIEVVGISVIKQPGKLNYQVDETLNLSGAQVQLKYNNNTEITVNAADFAANSLSTTPSAGTVLASSDNGNPVYIRYASTSLVAATDNLTVVDVDTIEIETNPTDTEYFVGDTLDLSGIEVKINYSNATDTTVGLSDFGAYGLSANPSGGTLLNADHNGTPVTVTLGSTGLSATTSNLSVSSVELESIVIETPPKLTYDDGDELDLSDLRVDLHYNNDHVDEKIAIDDFAANGLSINYADKTPLTHADHNGKNLIVSAAAAPDVSINVGTLTVAAATPTLTGIKGGNPPAKTVYNEGEFFDPTDLSIETTLSDGTSDTLSYNADGVTYDPDTSTPLAPINNTITVRYGGFEYTVDITVNPSSSEDP